MLQGRRWQPSRRTDTSYEIQDKAEAFDHRLQLSADVFYMAYRNFQLVTIPPGCECATSELLNAQGATIYEAEAEANAVPDPRPDVESQRHGAAHGSTRRG